MNREVLRIIDANANRAREALRVVEDYARFWLDNEDFSGQLKQLRHDFVSAVQSLIDDAILCRDTPGDVGTGTKTSQELQRADVGGVVTAAGKRFGEAVRTLEEFTKTFDPSIAAKLEAIRYRFYDLEMRVARTLRPDGPMSRVRLYLLVTEPICTKPWLTAVREAIHGGADCIQLREKGLSDAQLLHRARQLVCVCRRAQVPCIINDRPDIAVLAEADGVHVGQGDVTASEARRIVGRHRLVGVSTHTIDQAKQAVLDGADYIGVGPVFRSSTKPRDILPGLDLARHVAQEIRIPAVAIAGITLENVDEVLATGIRAVAVTAAVIGADDPREAARAFKGKLLAQSETGCPKT